MVVTCPIPLPHGGTTVAGRSFVGEYPEIQDLLRQAYRFDLRLVYACSARVMNGNCSNSRTISRTALEERVLAGLRDRLMAPDVAAEAMRAYAPQHLGYTVPPQSDCGWIGEAGPGPSYGDEGEEGPIGYDNDFTQRNLTIMTWNLLHLARMHQRCRWHSQPWQRPHGVGRRLPIRL